MGVSGDPDLYGLWNGTHWEVELKVPGASPTPLQCSRIQAWNRAGALTFVVHNLDEFDVAFNTIRRAALANVPHDSEGSGGMGDSAESEG